MLIGLMAAALLCRLRNRVGSAGLRRAQFGS